MSLSKEAFVMFSGKSGKGLTFEEFDNKVLSWARKQYGHVYAKQLWEDTLVDLRSLDLTDDLDYYGYPGRYYAVLRNTRVIPAIFESKLERVTCGYELKELDQRVDRPKNMLKT